MNTLNQKYNYLWLYWGISLLPIDVFAMEKLFQAQYTSTVSGLNLNITRTLTKVGDGYYIFQLRGKGGIVEIDEKSQFLAGEKFFIPTRYSYKRKVFGLGRKDKVNFNWEDASAKYYEGKSKPVYHELSTGILDAALYQLQMQKDLYNGQTALSYQYIQKDKIRRRKFNIVDSSTYELDGNIYEALVIKRVSENSLKTTEIWLIPDLFFHIAYIKQKQKNGDIYETKLKKLHIFAEPLQYLFTESAN